MFNDTDILLVEDNIHDAELTIRVFKKINLLHKLVHVRDGEEALDFIFARGKFVGRNAADFPRLILLDIKMPKVDGIEVLRQLKSGADTRIIPVVIMTSSKEDQDIIDSYHLGVNSYVVKPVDFEGFAKAIGELGMYWMLINQAPIRAKK
jgi:two-component system response regulator